ncbi:MAG: RNA polymerase sigma factor [bacterium]|nr:RNA polymerase sigma factor [bacterium]
MTRSQQEKLKVLLTEAHKSHERELKARAFFKVNDRDLCEDLVQKTFMKTWNYLMKGGEIETMKAFLHHVLNSLIVDEYRRRKATSLDALLDKGFEPGVDHTARLVNELDGKSASLLIKRLPPKYKKVIYMRYIKDLALHEMSDITGQSKNTIAVQIHRGLEMLRSIYNEAEVRYR